MVLCSIPEITGKLFETFCNGTAERNQNHDELGENWNLNIKGKVVLVKKHLLDFKDTRASICDRIHELLGKGVSLQLISETHPDPENALGGKLGKVSYLENWSTTMTVLAAEDIELSIQFNWDENMGVPGAFIIQNHHHTQFYLKTVTLEDVPGHGPVHFVCNSWVYPAHRYKYNRVFFSNKSYLPRETPELLRKYREEELANLRGDGSRELKEWDRVYDYDYYNDLGSPEKGEEFERPVLGGSQDHPYPRRGRTGRKPNRKDPKSESRLSLLSLNIYVPRDEQFGYLKFSDFLAYAAKSLAQVIIPELKSLFDKSINEFDTFEDIQKLYKMGAPNRPTLEKIRECLPWELVKELLRNDGESFAKFPFPGIIKEDESAWRTDEEFAREMLAGLNPVVIRCLKEFPILSKLDCKIYGNQDSSISAEHIEKNMNKIKVDEALKKEKLFILDHHDALMPYLSRINSTTTKTYATRTVLFLQDDGTLKPLAIELSLPNQGGDHPGAVSKVFTPSREGVEGSIWRLAKACVAVNDSGYHQLISHWLNTHAVIEPFIIATHRQLSVLHPIYKLLHPHFRDTMHINALARHILINAGGILERTVFPAKYAMEMSSAIYKNWRFTDQALPQDLINRGMAKKGGNRDDELTLAIKDYPFAVDGLEIWKAIKTWVQEYCFFYYKSKDMVEDDRELQEWWKEIRNVGHGDLKDQEGLPEMKTRDDLIHSCTIIIWVASALHAAVNFGQYPYGGYLPNRPSMSRRFVPEPGTPEYNELETNPDLAFLKTITAQFQTLLGVSLIEILSRHSSDEVYLGRRENDKWTCDTEPLAAFQRFRDQLEEIERNIIKRNENDGLKNRTGPVKLPYTLLYPNTSRHEVGLTGNGIPNSISI